MGGAVRCDIIGGGDTVELFASVDKGGGHTELAHVFEHDAVVGGSEGACEVRVHDVDVCVMDFVWMMEEKTSCMLRCGRNPSCWSLRLPWVTACFEHTYLISAAKSLRRLFMRAMGR
jgi:hypothetical protein